MGKQINSAKKMENSSKTTEDPHSKKEHKKIDDFFTFANRKRNREEVEKSKEEGILKQNNKSNLQVNNINIITNEKQRDLKEKEKMNGSHETEQQKSSHSKENQRPNSKNNINPIIFDLSLEENTDNKPKKKKENNNICSICRDGGDLLLCDKCPKSFHTHCLKINRNTLKNDAEWYCPACVPKLERAKKRELEYDERRKKRNEKKKLWRLRRKEELKAKSIDATNFNNIPLINDNFIQKLNIEKKKFENKNFAGNNSRLKYKNKMKSLSAMKNKKGLITNSSKKFMKDFIHRGTVKMNGNVKQSENRDSSLESDNEIQKSNKLQEFMEIPINDISKPLNHSNSESGNKNSLSNSEQQIPVRNSEYNYIDSCVYQNIMNAKNRVNRVQIKYPIDDCELYSNPEKYNLAENYYNKPKGNKSIIPDVFYTKVIKIWDVLDSFKSRFTLSQPIFPEDLYIALNYYGDREIEIINEIHISFIRIFYDQIKNKTLQEFFDDINMLMFKITYENTKPDQFNFIWLEILRFILISPFFNLMATDELTDLGIRLNSVLYNHQYNLLSIEEKLLILEFLCNTVLETDCIREIIKSEIEKKKELKTEINNLELELKSMDSRKKELERQEKFTQPKTKIDTLTKRLECLVEENPNLSRVELTKLRKELELEREQFKSVIKEADNLEVNRVKLVSKMEKIELDLYNLGTIHKKLIGVDGLRNEYYFHNTIPNKILIKRCVRKTKNDSKIFEWSEINNDEDIKLLLASLTEKGIRETNLSHKLKKLLNKKLKIIPTPTEQITQDELLGKFVDVNEHIEVEEQNKERRFLSEIFERLEIDISEYLKQDKKEWESYMVRQDLLAFVNSSDKVAELGKCLILLNDRFKNPFKQNDFKNKIISDEDEYCRGSYITPDGKIDLNYIDDKRIFAPKTKVWSTDYLGIDLEENFLGYLDNVRSIKSLIFACIFYDGITADLVKRRDVYKHFKKRENEIPVQSTENPNGCIKPNGLNEAKKESFSFTNKKIISDFDEYYYDDEQFEIQHKLNKEKMDKNKESFNNISVSSSRRSLRNICHNASNSFNNINVSVSNRDTKPKIKWNSECFVCEDGGDLILCEKCPNAAHLECVNLIKEPDFWTCEYCLSKLVNRRITRSNKI